MPLEFTGVRELAAAFGAMPAEIKVALQPAVLDAADVVATQARSNAAFSSWIPGAIDTQASFSASGGGAIVRVHEGTYPHVLEPRVLEGDGEGPTLFRHPVYNHGGWAPQMTHPFLHPALEDKSDEAATLIVAAVTSVVASHL